MALPLQRSFDDLGASLFDVPFCVLDVETTGGSPASAAITELGCVRYLGGDLFGTFHTLVNPGQPIPAFITVLTGITEPMVVQAPPIEAVIPAFLEFLGDAVVVGHNVRFDLGFLNAAALRLGYGRLPNRSVDTLGLARRLVRSDVRYLHLASLAAHFRSPIAPTHRALTDARATAHVFFALLEQAGTIGVTALDDLLELPTAHGSPHYQKIHLADHLPRRPGVYLFLDRNRQVIYVGKATNLRNRVRSYFYGDERRSIANLLRELQAVDHRVCETTLEAEITELRLIHAHAPRYNRRSRVPSATHWLRLTKERFPRLTLARTAKAPNEYLGPFRSRRSAELVMTAIWDALPIRRCSGRPGSREGPCAPAQLGVALCPCDGSLEEAQYRWVIDRFVEAIGPDPSLLLDSLEARMCALAAEQRYEEATWARDRHRALGRAIERRRAWQAMSRAGMVELESIDGAHALVDRGRLVMAWRDGSHPPLRPAPVRSEVSPVPETVETAEEAHLIWQWMVSGSVRVVDVEGELSLPAAPVKHLAGSRALL